MSELKLRLSKVACATNRAVKNPTRNDGAWGTRRIAYTGAEKREG